VREGSAGAAATLYLDDQKTRKYLEGTYNTAAVKVTVAGSEATVEISESGPRKAGAVELDRVVFYGAPFLKTVAIGGKTRKLRAGERKWIGKWVGVREG
jgi:hypothetical protein